MPETGPSHRAVVVTLSQSGDVEELLDVNEVAAEKTERLRRRLAGRTAIVDARLAGLSPMGLLDPDQNVPPATVDGLEAEWPGLTHVGYRVRRVPASTAAESDWRIELRWREAPDKEAADAIELRVELWRGEGAANAGDLAIARLLQELSAHCSAVDAAMAATAHALGLVDHLAILRCVASHHDAGKARSLWQRAMGAPCDGKIYGKTKGGGNPRLLQIGNDTYRHEFGSLRDTLASDLFGGTTPELRDLALHLIAAHHGHARPTIAAVDPDYPPSMCVDLAREVALRFARLNDQWGPWELAWWEAIFRAADWKGSSQIEAG
jgi:CRISPR-associated endonuclease/helicase Cas3